MKLVTLLLLLSLQCHLFGDNLKIYPTPQKIKSTGKHLTLNADILLIGAEEADPESVSLLRQLIDINGNKNGYKIYIGEQGDNAIKKYMQEFKKNTIKIPDISGAYYISVNEERTVIIGQDERGTFYALQTLAQLKNGNTLPEVEITDYPGVAFRGVVEGFYGEPWSYEDRVSQLAFYGQNKLNVYIYGPKDDPFHSSPNWRKPYPAEEAARISQLVKISNANKVDFTWAIHPGLDIRWNDEDRIALLNKFENMYTLGVRSFAVFFDDISGEGTDPERQAELLNFIDNEFISKKTDVTPLIMCPTEYNKSWSNPKPNTYLDILGDKLNPGIMIMWTGDRVISDITTEGLKWVNKRIKRPAYVWWNFPVNDYVRDHLLMGPSYGLDATAKDEMSGFVSNPMERAEASKIGIAGVADYSWNPSAYNSNDSWEHAVRTIMPQAPGAFRTFAAHNSDLGKNGHRYRRDESVEIKPAVEQFLNEYKSGNRQPATSGEVKNEFEKIKSAPGQLFATSNNPALIEEIRPWLQQFEVLGQGGIAAIELASVNVSKDPAKAWLQYSRLLQSEKKRENIDRTNNQNPYQPGIKTGSLIMQPFIDTIMQISGEELYKQLSGEFNNKNTNSRPALYTNIGQLKNLQLQLNGQSAAISPVLEVIKIQPGEYVGITFPAPISDITATMDPNTRSAQEWGTIEVSENGTDWKKANITAKGTELTASVSNDPVRYIIFSNRGTETKEFYLKKFTVTPSNPSVNKNNPALAQDNNLNTAYILLGNQTAVFNNPTPSEKTDFSILLEPHGKINISVTAVDSNNKSLKSGVITTPLGTFNCPAGTHAVVLKSRNNVSISIHEIIWK